jgi:anti-anti-sigma factor
MPNHLDNKTRDPSAVLEVNVGTARGDGSSRFTATLREPAPRPRLSIRSAGEFTVVDFVNADLLFEEDVVRDLGARLQRLVADGNVRLLVNLAGVRYACSTLLGNLAWLHRQVGQGKGFLRLFGLDPELHDALRVCRLDRIFEVYVDEASALAASLPAAQEPTV